jgi:hypothetical protein
MNERDRQLSEGLTQLHNQLSDVFGIVDFIQGLVPQIDFADHRLGAEASDDSMIESMTSRPDEYPDHERGTYQIPMFEMPVNIVFENVVINGESIEGEIDGTS